MKKAKELKNGGITLIALVITIIVLLILAGVSIAMLTGENGVLTKASRAKTQTEHAEVVEAMKLAYNEYQIMVREKRTSSVEEQEGVKIASTQKVVIKGNEENKLAEPETTANNFMEYVQLKGYVEPDGKVVIQNLLGKKLSIGNGTDDTDVYMFLEEDDSYVLKYTGKTLEEKEILWQVAIEGTAIEDGNLGKLIDVVNVGDYVNYSSTYSNVDEVTSGLGTGWRVAYKDTSSGTVTLVSEGVPASVELRNGYASNVDPINFDDININGFFDNTVANEVDVMDLEDVILLCDQAPYKISNGSISTQGSSYDYYRIDNSDDLNIINVGIIYILNTKGSNKAAVYSESYEHYFISDNLNPEFNTRDYYDNVGVRIIVNLKSNLEYYGGNGDQSNPYQIYQ